MSRLHPFAHVFAPLVTLLGEVQAEAEAGRRDAGDRAQFAMLQSVRQIVAGLEDPDTVEADPEAADEYVTALWVAYRFWDAGAPTVDARKEALAPRLDRPAPPPANGVSGVVYARLPERWVWAQVAPDAPHEPIDGLFLVPDAGGKRLSVLAVLGLRAGRPGFGQIAVHATSEEAAAAFGGLRTPAFAPVLDGGEAAGLRSVVTRGELLVLAQLAAGVGVPSEGT